MYDVHENEHQELFYLGIDPRQPLSIAIPSPLGPLGYYVYVRVPRTALASLDGVSTRFDVDGYVENHLSVAPGEGAPDRAVVDSTNPGLAWRCLGKAMVSRGDGTLVFQDWPDGVELADVLLCTWPRFVESGQAEEWIRVQADPQWTATGVPLGGIGCGRVDICRDGRFRNFSMNCNQDTPLENPDGIPGAFLAVTVDGITHDIATRPIMPGHSCCGDLTLVPRFPQATLLTGRSISGIHVTVGLSGMLAPHDLKQSSIPAVVVSWTLGNKSSEEREVRVSFGWPNLVGLGGRVSSYESGIGYGDGFYHHWDDPTGRMQEKVETEGWSAVRYMGNPSPDHLSSAGEHWLAVVPGEGIAPIIDAEACVASADVTIPPGQELTVSMALVTAMPHWIDSFGVDRGMYWQNHFPDGRAILDFVAANLEEALSMARALEQHMESASLPRHVRARLSNCTYPLVTNSVLYRDGRFSVNEGPTEMAGCYGTIDQRLAAHTATQILFPELNAAELRLFGAIQGEHGGIQHDLGGGHLERGPGETTWPDLTCSFIIQTAMHAWWTGDRAFESEMYPRARKALLRHAEWATVGDGVAQVGSGLGTSYDGYHYYGTTGYMATLWLAALGVYEKWAGEHGDPSLDGQIGAWREAAIRRLDQDLWNGKHFIAYGSAKGVRRETCHAGQLAGQVFIRLLCGWDVVAADRLYSCIDSLLELNGSDRFAVPPDEVNPSGEVASAFSWLPYVEGFMLTAVASVGDVRVLPLWERMMACVDGNTAHPCDTRLMYRPESGEQSWGTYYMTAPASWLVYEALLDFVYTPADGALRLRSTIPGVWPLVHPLFWATAKVTDAGDVSLTIDRVFSPEALSIRSLEIPSEAGSVSVDGKSIPASEPRGLYSRHPLPEPVSLAPGTELSWTVS